METPTSYRIMVFSWNTSSISICETLDPKIADNNRNTYSIPILGTKTKLSTWQYNCEIPDFYPKIREFIVENKPDIIVIGFQEDRFPGSYFHSHFLPDEMPKIGYDLIKRTKLMGLGITSYKGFLKGDPFERGIRVSIYAKLNLVNIIENEEYELRSTIANKGQDEYICSSRITRGKGATVSYLMLPGFGRLAFICCHLPFNSRNLINERLHNNHMLRQNELNGSNICFNNIIEDFVLFKNPIPTYVIYFGDFNYRLADPRPATDVALDFYNNFNNMLFIKNIYQKYDELKVQMNRNNIYEFSEGVDNQGPSFIPTCKLVKGRTTFPFKTKHSFNDNISISRKNTDISNEKFININDYWKTGKKDQRVPSWCDRVLYKQFTNDGHKLECTYYDRFDVGEVMSKSDHAGILSMFKLS